MNKKEKRYQPPEGAGQKALSEHVSHRVEFIRQKYQLAAPAHITPEMMGVMLGDSDVARFPVELRFSPDIEAGLFGYCEKKTENPQDGYDLVLHSGFQSRTEELPFLVLYLLVKVNYGEFATYEDAERFAAGILGLPVDAYYSVLCQLVDQTLGFNTTPSNGFDCSGGGSESPCSFQV